MRVMCLVWVKALGYIDEPLLLDGGFLEQISIWHAAGVHVAEFTAIFAHFRVFKSVFGGFVR